MASSSGGGIIGILRRRAEQRKVDETKDKIIGTMKEEGVDEKTLEVMHTIKADSAESLTAAFKNVQEFMKATPAGTERELQNKIKETSATTTATETAKLAPPIVNRQIEVEALKNDQKLQQKREEGFLDIEKQLTQKAVDLDAGEKQKLVFAQQGLKTVGEAQRLLTDENFIPLIFQSAGGTVGKLSTAGQTEIRNYNTAIGSSIFSFVFANSGAQVSDKERAAFEQIYGLQVGDTIENGKYKAKLLEDFFSTAQDIIDPNKVAGLSAIELKGKLNEIRDGVKALGDGYAESADWVVKALQDRALGNVPTTTQKKEPVTSKKMPSRSSAPKGAKGWDTEKGDWVF